MRHEVPNVGSGHLVTVFREAVARGRKRSEIQISISPYLQPVDLDAVRRYRDAGVEQLIFLVVAGDRDGLLARLDELAQRSQHPRSHCEA
jgi:hypothetical protein